MTRRAAIMIAAAMLLSSIAALSAQQPPQKGSIEGVILRLGTAAPLVGARVILTSMPVVRGGAVTVTIPPSTTGDRGQFFFGNLEAGTYRLQVQANGYLPQEHGQRFVEGPGSPITLAAGQSKTDVVVNLTPAGNVSGRLRDVNNQPLAYVTVQLLRPTYDATGVRRLAVAGGARTDERGEFRIFWVNPGRYFVRAGSANASSEVVAMMSAGGNANGVNPNVVPVATAVSFYPGAPDVAGARAIDVGPGADLTAIDWQLSPKPAGRRVRGRVIDARTGQPPKQAEVVIMPLTPGFASTLEDIDSLEIRGGASRRYNPATGAMDFPNLAPGVYLISALTREAPQPQEVPIARGGAAPSPYGPGSRIMAGTTIVAVSDFDIDDAVVSLGPGGSFTGRLRVEGELPAPTGTAVRAAPQPPRFNVQLINLRGQSILDYEGMSTIQAAADGSFQFNSVMAGEYRVAVRNLPPGAYVKSANLDGVDILRTPFVLTGPSSGSLDIVVSAKSGQIRGSLVDERSETIPLMQVVLVPMRDRGRVELYKTVVTDEAGSFNMTGVPPGDYRMFSWQSIEPFSWFDPDVVSRFEDRGSPVHVSESSTENVQVRLISQGAAQ